MGFKPARQRYIANQKPNALPTELSGRPTLHYYENLPMQYTEIFLALKIESIQVKNFDIFLSFAQNINCGYM